MRRGEGATGVPPKAGRTGKALLGRSHPSVGHTVEARSALERVAKSLDVFLPGRPGWRSQRPPQSGIGSLER